MSIPIDVLLEVAGRARGMSETLLVRNNEMRNNFEWAWGLGQGTLDEHVSNYCDSTLVDMILDHALVVVPEYDLVLATFRVAISSPWRFHSRKRKMILDLYTGRDTFNYLVLPLDPSSVTQPRVISSIIPPHLAIPFAVDDILRRAGYSYWRKDFDDICKSLVHVASSASTASTFTLAKFSWLEYIHTRWSIMSVPRRFLGLEGSVESVPDEDSDTDIAESSAMKRRPPPRKRFRLDEPRRRVTPEELKRPPVIRFWVPVVADDEDDAISSDSDVPGDDDPVGDRAWLDGVENWVESTSGVSESVPDEPIEDKSASESAWRTTDPSPNVKRRSNFEWVWGLERGTFDQHVCSYVDPKLLNVLFDENLVLIPHRDLVQAIYQGVSSQPWSFSSKKRVFIQDVYQGRETFEYLVLPSDPASCVAPRNLISPIPPHLTISCTVDQILRRINLARCTYGQWHDSLLKVFRGTAVDGATFTLTRDIFSDIRFIHESWGIVIVPPRFLGLEDVAGWEREAEKDEKLGEVIGINVIRPGISLDEPKRRLREDELKQDLNVQDDDCDDWD
ncbi:hypothetical protein FB45DRAFT_1119112 [Roridomyces roridus]|uniref:Uncharacterized protein n=1 Tax=Roridomyces roridus TaxID=1738132 RepID=A0AAD7FA74_9AGAR|nr:hypothetical protein FB45DRAFT_1119112 [Roridomyces roridus]